MRNASLPKGRFFQRIPSSCLEAYRGLLKFYMRQCVELAGSQNTKSTQVTDVVQEHERNTIDVAPPELATRRRLYQGEYGTDKKVLSTTAPAKALSGHESLVLGTAAVPL